MEDDVEEDADADADAEEEILDGDTHIDIMTPQQVDATASHETDDQTRGQATAAEACSDVFVEHFTLGLAGQPIPNRDQPKSDYDKYQRQFAGPNGASIYQPFASKADWEIARWAKVHGITSSAVSDLLGIEEVSGLDYRWLVVSNSSFSDILGEGFIQEL